MKKAMSFIALCMFPLVMYANMNGSHASLDRAIILAFIVFVVLVANFFLVLGNAVWKVKSLSIINGILSVPLAALCAYFITFNASVAICLAAVVVVQFLLIRKSIAV